MSDVNNTCKTDHYNATGCKNCVSPAATVSGSGGATIGIIVAVVAILVVVGVVIWKKKNPNEGGADDSYKNFV